MTDRPGVTAGGLLHEILASDEARRAMARRDIGAVYAVLRDAGVSQRVIADATGQSQSQVCEIIGGRAVLQVHVLERIADGLGVQRGALGIAYSDDVAPPFPEVTDDMYRRSFLAAVSAAAFGAPVLGEVMTLPSPGQAPLPSRLGMTDVHAVERELTDLRNLARRYGGQGSILGSLATDTSRLIHVPATEPVRARLGSVLAELHTEAGWAYYDTGQHDHARHHYRQAVDLAGDDGYQLAYALRHAGLLPAEHGDPNYALKLYQIGQDRLPRGDPRGPVLGAWLHAQSATALASADRADLATDELSAARNGWEPTDRFELANMNMVTGWVSAGLGQLDDAEPFLAASLREWGDTSPRDSVLAAISLADLHTRAGEPDGLRLASQAIDAVTPLRSMRARQRLSPLAAALESRPDTDARELARQARRVAAV